MTTCKVQAHSLQCDICRGEEFVTVAGPSYARAELCPRFANCALCRGNGFVRARDAHGYEVLRSCDLKAMKFKVQLFNEAMIPSAFHAVRLASPPYRRTDANRDAFTHFCDLYQRLSANVGPGGRLPRQTKGIGLSGAPGTGKTHLMAAMARHLVLDLGLRCRFTDFSQLLWQLKAEFDAGKGEVQLIAPLVEVEVLFIDEMGKGRGSEWERSILDALISERYNRGLMTFFATNYSLNAEPPKAVGFGAAKELLKEFAVETLEDRIGGRVASRLHAMCDLIYLTGASDARKPAGGETALGAWSSPRKLR